MKRAHSYTLRMQAAFDDLGEKATLKEMQAFVLLRQSLPHQWRQEACVSHGGRKSDLEGGGESNEGHSPHVSYLEQENRKRRFTWQTSPSLKMLQHQMMKNWTLRAPTRLLWRTRTALTAEVVEMVGPVGRWWCTYGAAIRTWFWRHDAGHPGLAVSLGFPIRKPELAISDRRRSRGFWPPKGRTKGHGKDHHGGFRGGRKGGPKGGKEELLSRISRTHCKLCGALGHWKAECPTRRDQARESANCGCNMMETNFQICPRWSSKRWTRPEVLRTFFRMFSCTGIFSMHPSKGNHGIPVNIRAKAVQFLSHRLSLHRSSSPNRMGIDKRGVKGNSKRGYQQKYDYTGAKDMMPRKSHRPTNMDLFQRGSSDATCLMSQLDRRSQNGTGLANHRHWSQQKRHR